MNKAQEYKQRYEDEPGRLRQWPEVMQHPESTVGNVGWIFDDGSELWQEFKDKQFNLKAYDGHN
jgi:hypothetical protein